MWTPISVSRIAGKYILLQIMVLFLIAEVPAVLGGLYVGVIML
jgi:hypothetical protein